MYYWKTFDNFFSSFIINVFCTFPCVDKISFLQKIQNIFSLFYESKHIFVLHKNQQNRNKRENEKKSYKMQMNIRAFPYCFHSLPLVTYCTLWKAFNVQIFCLERCIMRATESIANAHMRNICIMLPCWTEMKRTRGKSKRKHNTKEWCLNFQHFPPEFLWEILFARQKWLALMEICVYFISTEFVVTSIPFWRLFFSHFMWI